MVAWWADNGFPESGGRLGGSVYTADGFVEHNVWDDLYALFNEGTVA
jgi:hypothetical protein